MTAPPTPFRLSVMRALTDAYREIAGPAAGYANDLSITTEAPEGRVFRGRAYFGDNDPLPMVSILEDPRLVDMLMGPGASAVVNGDWNLIVQGFVEDDPANPTDAAYLLQDDVVRRTQALIEAGGGSKRNLLGFGYIKPCITEIRIGGTVVRPPDEFCAKANFVLALTLRLVE